MAGDQLPTGLLVEATLAPLNAKGLYYYIQQKGNHASGVLLVKLNGLNGKVRLRTQERNFMDDILEWVSPLPPSDAGEETLEESEADAYIQRAIKTDPDLWVVEIEAPEMKNPFEEA